MDFTYTALDSSGARVRERVRAESEDQAIRRLQSQGYTVLAMAPASGRDLERPRAARQGVKLGGRVKLDQVVALTREFAIMIETGVPVTEALNALMEHCDSAAIKEALAETHQDLSEGKTMAQAMGAHPRVFPPLYVNMVATAEAGGSLDETLNRAADYLEGALEMRRKVAGALTYPVVLLVVATGVVIFMMTYLLPQFSQLFARMNAEIPASTRFLLAASDFTHAHWWMIPLVIAGAIWSIRAVLRTPAGRDAFTRFSLRLPFIGDTIRKVAMARILRALGTLNATGVSLLIALETASQTAQNVVFERAMMEMRAQVEQGVSLTDAVVATGVFPSMVCQMVAVGEKSGRLSAVLMRVAAFYEADVDARLKMMASVIEPVMIVVLGLIVGFIAISIITPIYSLVGSVK